MSDGSFWANSKGDAENSLFNHRKLCGKYHCQSPHNLRLLNNMVLCSAVRSWPITDKDDRLVNVDEPNPNNVERPSVQVTNGNNHPLTGGETGKCGSTGISVQCG